MAKRIITINRMFGSNGRLIGKTLAENLDIGFYDKELIDMAAKKNNIPFDTLAKVDEKKASQWVFPVDSELQFTDNFSFVPMNDVLYDLQRKIILSLPQKEDCVIVGRCADYVLRHRNPLRLFFYADIADRMERCRKRNEEQKSLNHDVLRKIITQTDKNRSRYYEFLSGQKWGAKENYDLCINTSSADTEKIIQCVISLL